jgi:predicted RNA-binding Zn-ribbon protein involved in translation (DUF1610 family)
MSVREANCPSCGASITFATSVSVMVVCTHCGTASVRRDVDLEKMGVVADVAPIESSVSLGASGRWKGRRFTVIGQVQLDHGKGPWNEWCLAFEDGDVAWFAEAQGETIVTYPRPAVAPPLDQELGVGAKLSLAGETFVVAEAGSARVTAARGELPEAVATDATYEYFDLRGPNGRFATLAVHPDGTAETYIGDVAARGAFVVDETTVTRAAPRQAPSDRLGCPGCGSPVVLRDPANTQRVVCSSCGAMIDPRDRKLRVVEKAKRLEARPVVPIGAKARLRGQDYEVLAFLVRSVRADGVRYPWDEYLLKRADGAYHWLGCSDGHWSLIEPVNLGDVSRSGHAARWRGETFKHFQGGDAVVDHVQGEVYWEVAIGEKVEATDFVAPPRMLSFEKSKGESVVSVGHYLDSAEIAGAFPGVTRWPYRRGVAPHQPNRWRDATPRCWRTGGILAAATVALMMWFASTHADRVVATVRGEAPPTTASVESAAERGVAFSEEFRIDRNHANLQLRLTTNVANAWLGVDGSLVELDTGEVRPFEISADFYTGVESGERWTEGSPESIVYLGGIPAGRYALRLDAETQSTPPASFTYTLVATSQVPSTGRGFLLLLLLAAPPVLVTALGMNFESKRWSTSDHAPGGDDE